MRELCVSPSCGETQTNPRASSVWCRVIRRLAFFRTNLDFGTPWTALSAKRDTTAQHVLELGCKHETLIHSQRGVADWSDTVCRVTYLMNSRTNANRMDTTLVMSFTMVIPCSGSVSAYRRTGAGEIHISLMVIIDTIKLHHVRTLSRTK